MNNKETVTPDWIAESYVIELGLKEQSKPASYLSIFKLYKEESTFLSLFI
jgi:hypothetical protein